jgi:organic hydroperoxide reductase OsmC/OhrA
VNFDVECQNTGRYRVVVHGNGSGGRTELIFGDRTVKIAFDEAAAGGSLNAPGAVLAATAASLQQSALRIIVANHADKLRSLGGVRVQGSLDVRRDGDDGNYTSIDRLDLTVSVTDTGGNAVSWLPHSFGATAEASCPLSQLLRAADVPLKVQWP